MTNEELKKLENNLWDSANSLRAFGGIKAADYAVPILGLIFLRFADNKYSTAEADIQTTFKAEQNSRMGGRNIEDIAIEKCGFYLSDAARYDYLLNLPGDKKMAQALKTAMQAIEDSQDADFVNVLPKDAYAKIEEKNQSILPELVKTFSDIPKNASGDIFGKIYEYFLGKFALSEGQKGGEFFTPTSVVRFIVEVIEPNKGTIFDPACGSGGMFVQSANFIKKANHPLSEITVYGQEHMAATVRLAKMNLMVNNLAGEIIETNSYEKDPHKSFGKFDYVMANPPFNVKSVKESTVKDDKRFTAYGLPKPKGKKDDKITDANYLWISLFATSLNKTGRAGFVMPNSASDARNAEFDIRKKIIDSGIVDCMVTIPTNMFYTVTLPATLWFFDKAKAHDKKRKDTILFIDARKVFTQIDRAHREWSEEQIQNLSVIVKLHRGEQQVYLDLIQHYITQAQNALQKIPAHVIACEKATQELLANLLAYEKTSAEKRTKKAKETLKDSGLIESVKTLQKHSPLNSESSEKLSKQTVANKNAKQLGFASELETVLNTWQHREAELRQWNDDVIAHWKTADKILKRKADPAWGKQNLTRADKSLEALFEEVQTAIQKAKYWYENMHWLQNRFPEATYQDVVGLCNATPKSEYAEEQDYSLNAARYVGIEMEKDPLTEEEFIQKIKKQQEELSSLTKQSSALESAIQACLSKLIA